MEEKKRWRTKIKNAKECRISLSFPDLQVRFSNGYSLPLKVVEGEEILMDLLDPEDIKKSWLVGSLKGYLSNDWIESFTEESSLKDVTPISQFITEQMVMAPKPNLIKQEVVQKQAVPIPQPNLPEVIKVVEQQPISIVNEQITDLSLVKTYADFNKLSHFLKLRFIKENSDIELLRQIQTATTSSQFKNNLTLRLSTLKV
jgi:hypothetical protein